MPSLTSLVATLCLIALFPWFISRLFQVEELRFVNVK